MYRLGIDLGGTNIAVGVVDDNYKIVGRGKVKTGAPCLAETLADNIVRAVHMAIDDAGISVNEISSMGIGAPGTINPQTGVISYSNNLGLENVPIAQMLKDRLGVSLYMENDANAAAYGEYIAGAGKGTKNFIAVTLGTGVGGGIIIDGKLYSGSNYAGAELGHTVICMDGEQCTCGRKGCFEAYASATALIRQTKVAMKEDKTSIMWKLCGNDINAVNGRTAFDGMRKNDLTAINVVRNYQKYIGEGITNIINIFQPDMLCIGGGISNEKETLTCFLNELIKQYRYSKYLDKQTVVRTAALGNDAGIIGAAFLCNLHNKN